MDAYQVYLNTLKYVMSADPEDKSTWGDILKYIPCLHQMLSCCVCGNLLNRPQGPINSVCLHHVCHDCVGGKMRLKPSCSWCKNHEYFTENKKLRVLVLCFKRLCAYISHSNLGSEIMKLSSNGTGKDSELTRQVLNDAEQFVDEYTFTAPSSFILPKSLKSSRGPNKFSPQKLKPSTSGVGACDEDVTDRSTSGLNCKRNQQNCRRGRRGKLSLKSPQSNAFIHVKRLKKKALSARNNVSQNTKKFKLNRVRENTGRFVSRKPKPGSSGLLVAQRPHRELSGKFSVGQLWRETFLEEIPPEPEIYPDSGIEVGNVSDQDHGSQPPSLKQQNESEKSSSNTGSQEKMPQIHVRDTRLHPVPGPIENCSENTTNHKSRLTITISKKKIAKAAKKGKQKGLANIRDSTDSSSSEFADRLPNKLLNLKRRGIKKIGSRLSLAKSKRRDICRCARFKKPNQLTCFGQKCPCYRDKKGCVDCLCNGCKNPRPKPESVPSLTHHVINESSCMHHGVEPVMPRLSPIPRI